MHMQCIHADSHIVLLLLMQSYCTVFTSAISPKPSSQLNQVCLRYISFLYHAFSVSLKAIALMRWQMRAFVAYQMGFNESILLHDCQCNLPLVRQGVYTFFWSTMSTNLHCFLFNCILHLLLLIHLYRQSSKECERGGTKQQVNKQNLCISNTRQVAAVLNQLQC